VGSEQHKNIDESSKREAETQALGATLYTDEWKYISIPRKKTRMIESEGQGGAAELRDSLCRQFGENEEAWTAVGRTSDEKGRPARKQKAHFIKD